MGIILNVKLGEQKVEINKKYFKNIFYFYSKN